MSYKEIVTKAVIAKRKKLFKNDYEITLEDKIDTVLGCWVINHKLYGEFEGEKVAITGSFDVNIWYSYDGNSKTDVVLKRVNYKEIVTIPVKEDCNIVANSDILIECLKSPVCTDVKLDENTIRYTIEKELGIEIIADTKVKIAVEDKFDDYEEIKDELTESVVLKELENIDEEVNENYLQ